MDIFCLQLQTCEDFYKTVPVGLAKKHISHCMYKTNSLAGLTLIFLPNRTACISSFICNVMPLSIKKGRQARGKKKKINLLNSSNLFSIQVCFNELQQFQLIGPLISAESEFLAATWSPWNLWECNFFYITLIFGGKAQYLENKTTTKLQVAWRVTLCTSFKNLENLQY